MAKKKQAKKTGKKISVDDVAFLMAASAAKIIPRCKGNRECELGIGMAMAFLEDSIEKVYKVKFPNVRVKRIT